ncbi:hypothetical protein GS534_00725 [Rhodococcus hoagii]|nr:hypothetical protein [Prescottella equi]
MNTKLDHQESESIEENFKWLVNQELKDRTGDSTYRRILSEPGNRVAWLRVLIAIDRDIAAQGEIERATLQAHPGIGSEGRRPTGDYLAAHREYSQRKRQRATFHKHLYRRIAHVEGLIGYSPVTDGMVANLLVDVDLLLESGNLNDARGRLQGMIRRLDNAA